ncbi:amidinotransferase [Brachybacterium endophyticum]|uniref:Amidinotransferase n=1 Tax=Brachybacterium endophyticum TaxID=2182385 RepID=A0A2U2RNU0_9MICO|nr:arginine deiminase-related protein [Brachybacterium endophyticum]PWH07542.1 amidinotransferase [Brachybacterium endophyticum]
MSAQAPSRAILVRPHHFTANPETALDNAFEDIAGVGGIPPRVLAARARREVTELAGALRAIGVEVDVFDDDGATTPDSVFPNNWLSTHPDGTLALFPMYAPSRRAERRRDIVDHVLSRFRVRRVVDYSCGEHDDRFLEGTGAMVLDHVNRLAFACRSRRLSPALLEEVCADLGYEPLLFTATDTDGVPVYHTNVLMSIGTDLAVVGSGMIRDRAERERVLARLREGGRTVVEIDESQVRSFLGNCLEVEGRDGHCLLMSATAEASLTPEQRRDIERSCRIVAVPVPTIETAGGSVRCMIAGVHLEAAEDRTAVRDTQDARVLSGA